jgi:S-adenosylmethionine:tRNA ribosyltransferase-isomerase
MRTSELDYELPPERVAQFPPPRREQARLLVVAGSQPALDHRRITDLPRLLEPADLLVVNDTKVLPARLVGRREPGGGKVETLLLEEHGPRRWEALLKPARRVHPGSELVLAAGELRARILAARGGGSFLVQFAGRGRLRDQLARLGSVPLPPYIRRVPTAADRRRYQAPTAGLHLTRGLLARLRRRGVRLARLTLQVGPGTFTPIRTDRLEDHHMQAERFSVPAVPFRALAATRRAGWSRSAPRWCARWRV